MVFGSVFVADDKETAKKIAMEKTGLKNYNCVTVDGDFYRADGVLSGGADTSQPCLKKIQEYLMSDKDNTRVSNELERKRNQLQELQQRKESLKQKVDESQAIKSRMQID